MSFTESEIELIHDHLRSSGFYIPDTWDNEDFGKLATAILEALDISHE